MNYFHAVSLVYTEWRYPEASKHGWVDNSPNIGRVSRLSIQLWERRSRFGSHFRQIYQSMAIFQVRRYDLPPAHRFLLALNIPPTVQANGDLVLADEEVSLFDSTTTANSLNV